MITTALLGVLILTGVLLYNTALQADWCSKECKSRFKAAITGTCDFCKKAIPYDADTYCPKCSEKLNRCEGCGLDLTKKDAPAAEPEKDSPEKDEPEAKKKPSDVNKIVAYNNKFAFDLYGTLCAEKGNLFFSPYSISSALAMTYAGANGETAKQMAKTLFFGASPDALHAAFAELNKEFNAPDKKGYELSVANMLWGQKGYNFLPAFLDLTKKFYGAGLTEVDFEKTTESARLAINKWVEKETKDKIKDILKEGSVDKATKLVLTNAIYFKGKWQFVFDKKGTKNLDFRLPEDKSVETLMMQQESEFNYAKIENLQILEMPYRDCSLTMAVLLPDNVNGLPGLEKTLNAEQLDKWLEGMKKQKVEVGFPQLKFSKDVELSETLKAMGMADAFDLQAADFSGMDGKKDLFISGVIHKAFVEVNEEGTEAAAATAVTMEATAMPEEKTRFWADHPFIFLIRDTKTKSILFIGRVENPKE
jgi:serpin B